MTFTLVTLLGVVLGSYGWLIFEKFTSDITITLKFTFQYTITVIGESLIVLAMGITIHLPKYRIL